MARATELGVGDALAFLREVDSINARRRTRMVELTRDLVGGVFPGRTVGVLGIAFKPDSDDIRDSPALEVAAVIHDLGAHVRVYDPVAMPKARRSHAQLEYAESAEAAAREADVLLLLTEWPEFRNLDPGLLGKTVAERKIADGRNTLVPEVWREAGWDYRALGRPMLTVAFAT
jgi:UDP-glucose 6-dehydrogenase